MAAASNYPGPNLRIMASVGASYQDVQIFFPPDMDPSRKLGALAALIEKLDQEAPGLVANYVAAKKAGDDPGSREPQPGFKLMWIAELDKPAEPEPAAAPPSDWQPEDQAPVVELSAEEQEAAAARIHAAAEGEEVIEDGVRDVDAINSGLALGDPEDGPVAE